MEAAIQLDHQLVPQVRDVRELAVNSPLALPRRQAVSSLDVPQVPKFE